MGAAAAGRSRRSSRMVSTRVRRRSQNRRSSEAGLASATVADSMGGGGRRGGGRERPPTASSSDSVVGGRREGMEWNRGKESFKTGVVASLHNGRNLSGLRVRRFLWCSAFISSLASHEMRRGGLITPSTRPGPVGSLHRWVQPCRGVRCVDWCGLPLTAISCL